MKVNAPEKIYFCIDENGTHYYTEGIPFEREYIEYTRADAFVKKACEYLEPILTEYAGFYGGGDILQHFKNYMKEE